MTTETRPAEIDDWDQHWAQFGAIMESGPLSMYRKKLIVDLLRAEGCRAGSGVLDVGSGRGAMLEAICHAIPGVRATGLELSEVGVRAAQKRLPSARFIHRDLLVPVEPNTIPCDLAEFAVCSEVLEHVDVPEVMLRNAARYMSAGCVIVVTVPCGPMSEFERHLGHRRHYSPDEIAGVIERSGFEVRRRIAAGFPFLNLFRLMMVIRGAALIDDAAKAPTLAVRLTRTVFAGLFRLNLNLLGWQTVVVARKRAS